ncbi:hypothetical protein BG006_009464 [Podila minutissima]|uniref:Zn(2)-C6 fungal-type domain-containing protein n=1 Tax=Podila minutissima TaxID=64525 RepID=A0A9P5SI87_9FUNG|nr:hypothetical protein BG006_009464 [Podila minutissima]
MSNQPGPESDLQIKQEPYQSPPQGHQQYQNFQQTPYSQQSSSSGQGHGYGGASPQPFQTLPPNTYNLANHLMNMNVQNGPSSSSGIMGVNSVHHSGSTTPAMSANPLANASAPSSPVMGHQYPQYSHSSGSNHLSSNAQYYINNIPTSSGSNLGSNFYSSSNNSPPHQHQEQQQQQQQQQSQQQSQHSYQSQSHGSYGQFNSGPTPSTAPTLGRHQYAPLVPPLTDAQYQQYQQLLGSPFSSAASTPYHSNQSTPYSSMPASPTLEYQQLPDGGNMTPKPKRRQVKNACVNCQKACKKCDEGRPCTRCIKYGLTDTCVDSTRKVRKKGVKRGPYKRRPPPTQIGSASASTTPTLTHAVLPGGPIGYMSEPVTAISSPTQSHMLPFTSSAMGPVRGAHLDFGYGGSNSGSGYAFQSQMDNSYVPPPYSNYGVPTLYSSTPYNNDNNQQ